MRDKFYRGISFLLTLIMIIGLFPQLQPSVNAEGIEKNLSAVDNEQSMADALEFLETHEEESLTLALSYDDHYDVSGKTVEIIDAGTPTSYQVGYGVEENAVLDTAVVTLEGDKLIATGIGSAKVKIDGEVYTVTVKAAPISLFMITGHSMGAGQAGSKTESVVGPDGQVYSSHGTANLSASTQGIGISYAALNRAKNVNAFTESGEGTIGEGSALAWEWNRLTDEKVWVLNTAVGGSCLKEWIPGTTNYKNAVKQYRYAQEILSNEIRAGHYTLSHMGILYHNGANFSYKGVNYTQADLQNWYEAMWSGFKAELMRDMDGNGTKETAEFLGMIPIWTKSAGISYTEDEPAGLYMAACDEYEDIFTASVIGQEWLTNSAVAANFPEINYTTQDGTAIRQPQTTGDVFAPDSVHYQQVGYNAVGIDIAREIVTYLNGTAAVPTVKILLDDGRTEAGDTIELNYQEPVLLVPVVEPITVNDLSFEIAGCVEAEYPLQVKAISNGTGSLSIYRGKTVLKTITFTCNDAPKQLALSYDDHYDVSGKTVEIIDAGSPTSYQVGYGVEENAVLDTAVVTLEGDTLVATGIGSAKVKIDGETYAVTVDKAKLHLVVIMGQSNAGNHFDNATSDVVCKPGTAYWWGNGLGTNATEPAPYTQPSKGFHTPLIAELYAQSAAAGDPVKPVMIWHEGITSKNGQSITKWAASATDTGGTNDTVTMIENCLSYYEQHSDKYEIVGKGVYWLQGESDIRMNPEAYTQRFMAMWNRLKAAGMEYLAFLRVRWDTKGNGEDHQDLHYSASLSAQLQMINENPEFYMATDLTENWVGTADTVHTVDISNYITMMETYGGSTSYTDTYGNNATYANGKLTTTMKTLYGSNNKCHYGKFGYGLIGADAAYNMYRALHTDSFAIAQTDTSGHADAKKTAVPGSVCKIDITELNENLAFRADCGSTAGTLAITVKSGAEDITDRVIADGLNTYGTVDTALLRIYEEPIITVTFTPVSGKSGSVVYQIEDNSPEAPKMYFWGFEQDMNARDENGEIVNGFGDAVYGSYVLEDGKLKATDLHIALENTIRLSKAKNWSIEWKFGEITEDSKGFLFSSKNENVIGNKAFYHVKTGQFMISDYADSKGYRNYTLDTVLVSSGDVMKITNRFDPESGRSIMSLWQNGELVIEDFQLKGSFNAATSDLDMTSYPLSGEFLLSYMGSGNFATVTDEFEYIRVIPDTLTYDAEKTIALSYDDHYDLSGKTVEIIDAGSPTSYQVGYGVEENAILDTAVITLTGDTLVATGIGTAKVKIDGETYTVTVKAAPISLLLLAGQSNMRGSEGNANQSIICPDGMVYSTYGDDRGADNTAMTKENAHLFAASALAGDYSTVNVAGNTDCLSGYPLNTLTEAGAGKIGPDSGFAYEWVKQTGEKVWVVNAAHGGTSISVWQKGTTEYEQCKALFTACQETLRKEIAAGHYTLSHMAYFWCQGCSDRAKTAEWYVDKYLAMHDAFKSELTFDHDSDPATAEKTFEFGGIIPVRVGSTAACYRDGVNSDTNTYSYHEAFVDLRMSGSRAAQFWMGNNPELEDIWNVCTIGDDWVWMPDGTNGVSEYFKAHYPGGTVDYTPQVAQKASWYTPTTPKAVHDTIHYNQIGYNEIGRESVRNALIMMGINEDYDEETTVEFVNWTGYQPAEEITAYTSGQSGTLVVPIVSPITRCKDVTYTVTEGLTYKYYDLLAESGDTTGTLTAVGANTASVNVVKQAPGALYADHLAELPEKLCKGVNLWSVLDHDPMFYSSGTHWGTHSSGTVYSVTIPVQPGDKLYATSFGKAGENGHATANGIRVTFFGDYSVVKTLDPGGTYAEFKANGGYLVAPEGATAINIPLWTNEDSNEVYILGLEHDKTSEICSICGKSTHEHSWSDWETVSVPSAETQGVERRRCSCGETDERKVDGVWQKYALADHLAELPENVCHDTNLWAELEHDEEYFASGVRWGVYSGGSVCSVTIPVIAGEKVYASSFGKSGENGHATSNGIRTTLFDAYGVAKTMTPAENYAEFKANGGYLIVPEGAIAISIAMWTDSDEWEIYLMDRGHTPGEAVKENEAADGAYDSVVYCTACGAELSREHVEGETHTPGDINGDGSVNNKDFTRLFQCLADWDVEVVEAALDVNGDGTVNNKDLTRLFQYLSDWDVVIH